MKRLGFFGGCFNPPTIAHIKLIEMAINEANLDKAYFVPMGDLYEKSELESSKHRINMLKLAVKNSIFADKLDILDFEANSKERMYAIDSFKIIENTFKESENFFIMGSDNFEKIKNWKSSAELLKNYNYIILDRQNINSSNENKLNKTSANVIIIKSIDNLKAVSSSLIRKNIKEKKSLEALISKDVETYILENKLYK